MKREKSYKELENDLAEFKKTLKTITKSVPVEKVVNDLIEDVRFQAAKVRE